MGYFPVRYNSRVIIYERKMFIRLPTGLVVMGGDSCPEGRGFKSQHHILHGHFSHVFVLKLKCLFEMTKIKGPGNGPFFKGREDTNN